jgi:formylglycine-generating enzyme
MVRMPEGYCIDSVEVGGGEYDAWAAGITDPTTVKQSPGCSDWNLDFTRQTLCVAAFQGGGERAVCVDWCDASAYCFAVGKRLCGKIGGGSNGFADYADPQKSEWYNACTSHGLHVYPYGDSYQAASCNGKDTRAGLDQLAQVSTPYFTDPLLTCQSSVAAYAGVLDLSGSAAEWEDSCAGAGPTALCQVRGGSAYDLGAAPLRCDAAATYARNATTVSQMNGSTETITITGQYWIGFRCCADAGDCTIDSEEYTSGSLNPSNSCRRCHPTVSTTSWTQVQDGTPCGGGICRTGTCVPSCFIKSTYYAPGDLNPTNPCQSCQPDRSQTSWSNLSDGTSCGDQICIAGICQPGCFVGTGYANSGPCQGPCKPDSKQCNGNVPLACAQNGQWQEQTPCGGSTPYCGQGVCAPCPASGGPSMTMVKLPQGYCIDSTKVTKAQYYAWLATKPPIPNQTSVCSQNRELPTAVTPTEYLDGPENSANWCDAAAYCASFGKHLCGKIGGGNNQSSAINDASSSQWYSACSSGGRYQWPYGNTKSDTACTLEYPAPVGSITSCQSPDAPYQGVLGMAGTTYSEWDDACQDNDMCPIRGAWDDCKSYDSMWRLSRSLGGFRCCAL